MQFKYISLFILFPLLALAKGSVGADPAPTPTTLAAALMHLPDTEEIVLAVDAAKVSLPKDATPPRQEASVTEIAQTYGFITQGLGAVTAVAPPTMVVLNTEPAAQNPFVGLPSDKALKLLLGSLTDDQWKMLTNEHGIGTGDLSRDDQRALFGDVMPPAPWEVSPAALIGTVQREGDHRDLTSERPQARLRLRLHVGLNLPAVDGKNIVFISPPDGPRPEAEGGHLYSFSKDSNTASGDSSDAGQIAGVPIRAEVPNTPKESELDTARPALQVRVPLAGLHTVGDLISRIGKLTHLEIYADAHYEGKSLTILGKPTTAPAADLLRAVAFCLTATYRRVGPAFVLTDDIQGIGTRRQILEEFSKDLDARRQAALDGAGNRLAKHSALALVAADSALALSDSERKEIIADKVYQKASFIYKKFSFSALSPSQQQAIRSSTEKDREGEPMVPDLTAQVTLHLQPLTEWILPSLDGPIAGDTADGLLMGAPAAETPLTDAAPAAVAQVLPSWSALMQIIPQRALHVHPRTAAQASADAAAAKMLGVNQLWVDTFSDGEARDTPLEAALKATGNSGIQVFAVLNLLNWGPKAKADLADLTIMGETSAQAESRKQDRQAQIAADKGETLPSRTAPDILVSLFAPAVRKTLLALVTRLAGKPGLAGMVWRTTDPAGYTLLPGSFADDRPALGNTVAARLAFLRQTHIDPLDLPTSQILLMGTNTSLPLYEGSRYSDTLYAPLEAQWRLMRSEANVALLQDLYAAVQISQKHPQILIQDRGDHLFEDQGWYGTWDGLKAPLPAFIDPWNHAPEGQPAYSWDNITQARPQSRLVLTRLPLDGLLGTAEVNAKVGLDVQAIATQRAKTPKLAWDGFVLEAVQEALPDLTAEPLLDKPKKPLGN